MLNLCFNTLLVFSLAYVVHDATQTIISKTSLCISPYFCQVQVNVIVIPLLVILQALRLYRSCQANSNIVTLVRVSDMKCFFQFYNSLSIVRTVERGRLRWTGHAAKARDTRNMRGNLLLDVRYEIVEVEAMKKLLSGL